MRSSSENNLEKLDKGRTKIEKQHTHSFFSKQALIKKNLHDPPDNLKWRIKSRYNNSQIISTK